MALCPVHFCSNLFLLVNFGISKRPGEGALRRGQLSDKLAVEDISSMPVGCKLFKHPYARNNHANERQETEDEQIVASIK